jgi:diaminohydroxyphosphoribosylaminopyrimidine deaminase/5-amino-6-(5-phosphoribosylamino)uracil reductase
MKPSIKIFNQLFSLAQTAKGHFTDAPLCAIALVRGEELVHLEVASSKQDYDRLTENFYQKIQSLDGNFEIYITSAHPRLIDLEQLLPYPIFIGPKKKEAELNEVYHHNQKTKLPYIHLKWAQTLDGKIATNTGDSKWISNEKARVIAHHLRGLNGAVLVGTKTALADDPQLNIRHDLTENFPEPRKIIFGNAQNLNLELKLLNDPSTIILTTKKLEERIEQALEARGLEVIEVEKLDQALSELYQIGIRSILVEGGGGMLSSFLNQGLAQKATVFIAPKILGGGLDAFRGLNIESMSNAFQIQNPKIEIIDNQILLEGYLPSKTN